MIIKKHRRNKKYWGFFLSCIKKFALFIFIFGFSATLIVLFFITSVGLPNVSDFSDRRVAQSTKIYDRTGEILLYDIHGEEKRTIIPFDEIPRMVKNATVALEDDTFYTHYGFRPFSFVRALISNIISGKWEQGGSTITQQLVKNTLLTNEKKVVRKLKEIVIALKIERVYSKDDILNLYLNQIPYGSNAYGIESAAITFFGKHAKDMDLLETAYLVSLPNAPSYFSPYGKHKKELDDRAKFALKKMRSLNFISQLEYDAALKEEIKFTKASEQGIIAPHFIIDVREELNNKFGDDVVEKNGLRVITTLDIELQKIVENVLNENGPKIKRDFNATNASVVIIDPKTGDLLALAGSRDYFSTEIDGNFNVATARRQPGSSFKPFVYATAFKDGFSPETVVFDLPTEFNASCTTDGKPGWVEDGSITYEEESKKCYHPQNYDNKYRGPVSLRSALAQSLNVPSVKVLYLTGLENTLLTAKDFGITSLNEPDRYGLSLVLGGGEVSLLELTSAYGVFANDGVRNPYRDIIRIEDSDGKIIFNAPMEAREVIEKNIARAITDILSDNNARSPAFGEASSLFFPNQQVAVKTGTTNDYRDAWVLGYTPDIVIGAWAGNNNNTPMEKRVAGFIVAPFWHEIMEKTLVTRPLPFFIKYNEFQNNKPWLRGEWRGGQEYIVDKLSQKLANEFTPEEFREKKVIMEIHSILYWLGKQSDPQFKNWETPIRNWALSLGFKDEDQNSIPTNYDTTHIPENFPRTISIDVFPKKQFYILGDKILIRPVFTNTFPIKQIDFFVANNEIYLGSVKKQPFEFNLEIQNNLIDIESMINLKIITYDNVSNKTESIFNIPFKKNN